MVSRSNRPRRTDGNGQKRTTAKDRGLGYIDCTKRETIGDCRSRHVPRVLGENSNSQSIFDTYAQRRQTPARPVHGTRVGRLRDVRPGRYLNDSQHRPTDVRERQARGRDYRVGVDKLRHSFLFFVPQVSNLFI